MADLNKFVLLEHIPNFALETFRERYWGKDTSKREREAREEAYEYKFSRITKRNGQGEEYELHVRARSISSALSSNAIEALVSMLIFAVSTEISAEAWFDLDTFGALRDLPAELDSFLVLAFDCLPTLLAGPLELLLPLGCGVIMNVG